MGEVKNKTFNNHLQNSPKIIKKYLTHIVAIEGKSIKTAQGYYYDLIRFFTYMYSIRFPMPVYGDEDFDTFDITKQLQEKITGDFVQTVTKEDVLSYLYHLKSDLKNKEKTRNRRLSAVKQFYRYCEDILNIVPINPTANIGNAKEKKSVPKYLTLDESIRLLDCYSSKTAYERDYLILTLFLNCALRLSELVSIDIKNIKDDTVRILGKGSKERIVHLNKACLEAYDKYMQWRFCLPIKIKDEEALFVSSTTGTRLSPRMVEKIVEKALKQAGLDKQGYSPHKLRHTAATLMYQHGGVDVRVLKDVLGHENLNTTQIYTHTNNKQVQEAFDKNPLADKGDY